MILILLFVLIFLVFLSNLRFTICYILQMKYFKRAIEDMASRSLRCVAIAYRPVDPENVPDGEEQLSKWALPEDDLVLLAIVGLKVVLRSST